MSTVQPIQLLLAVMVACLTAPAVLAQSSPAGGPGVLSEMPIEDYLALLRQIAPAAESGARAYLGAQLTRCHRRLRSGELRRAFAEGRGDPQLMALIRAAQVRDQAAMQRIAQSIDCSSKATR